MNAVLNRLREPSTWAGLAVLAQIVAGPGSEALGQSIAQVGTGLAGLLAVFLAEKK